jgi:hypothetical protein
LHSWVQSFLSSGSLCGEITGFLRALVFCIRQGFWAAASFGLLATAVAFVLLLVHTFRGDVRAGRSAAGA